MIVVRFDQRIYQAYLDKLGKHLFGEISIKKILNGIHYSHRERRFMALYLLKDKETFHTLYENREKLGIEQLFNQVISALFYKVDKCQFKQDLIEKFEIQKEMITSPATIFEVKEVTKDINSFIWYVRKRQLLGRAI